jgi:hypothetical protein
MHIYPVREKGEKNGHFRESSRSITCENAGRLPFTPVQILSGTPKLRSDIFGSHLRGEKARLMHPDQKWRALQELS